MGKEEIIEGCISGTIKLTILNINTLNKVESLIPILNSMHYNFRGRGEKLKIKNSKFLGSKNLCYSLNWLKEFAIGYARDTHIPECYDEIDCVEFISFFKSDIKTFLKNW